MSEGDTATLQRPGQAGESRDLVDGAQILWAGFVGAELGQEVEREVASRGVESVEWVDSETLDDVDAVLGSSPVGVLALGPGLAPGARVEYLEALAEAHPFQKPALVVVGAGDDLFAYQGLVQADHLFYLSAEPLLLPQLAELLVAALLHFRAHVVLQLASGGVVRDPRAAVLQKRLGVEDSLRQSGGLEALSEPVLDALHELVGIDGGRLWLYDRFRHSLRALDHIDHEVSAVAGLTSWAARTGIAVCSALASEDSRYDAEADGEVRCLLAVPVIGPRGWILGVLAVWRRDEAPFDEADQDIVAGLADSVAPYLTPHGPRPLEAINRRTGAVADLFREEALEASSRGFSERGKVLRNTPGWTRWTWATLVTGFFAGLLFLLMGRMHDYASGPAVVRVGERVEVTSHLAAAVTSVLVAPAQVVTQGQPLVRFYGAPEASEIANLEEEFDQRLRQRLAAPADTAVEASLVDVRTRLERARVRLADRIVRAPVAGEVGDVRIRPGQHLVAGEILLSVIADPEQRTVVGLIPGQFGPQIAAGQTLRLTLEGYEDLSFDLQVRAVGEEVITVGDARLSPARAIAELGAGNGPVVLVEARLAGDSFRDGGRTWAFRDGMQGSMEVRVRSQPILFHLVPGLDRVVGRWRDG